MDERLKIFIQTLNLKQIEISRRLGISHSNITRYLKGDNIPISVANALLAKFNLNPGWLLKAEGPMFLKNEALDRESEDIIRGYYSLDEKGRLEFRKYLELQTIRQEHGYLKKNFDKEFNLLKPQDRLNKIWNILGEKEKLKAIAFVEELIKKKNESSNPTPTSQALSEKSFIG